MSREKDYTNIIGAVLYATPQAFLFEVEDPPSGFEGDDGNKVWIPKSTVKDHEDVSADRYNTQELMIETWFLRRKGLL